MPKPVRSPSGDTFDVPSGSRIAHVRDAGQPVTYVLDPSGAVRVLDADGTRELEGDAGRLAALFYFRA